MDPIWTGAAASILAAGGFMSYAVRGRSSSVLAPSVYHGDRGRPVLSLTFDDGPSESTPALLEILSRLGVQATFFMCGHNVRRLPAVAREVRAAGHEIGNHSDMHRFFQFKSTEFIYGELARAQESIQAETGEAPHLFRTPYGVRWFGLREAQRRLDLTGVMWTVLGRDWTTPAGTISRRLVTRAANGGILCLHDGRALQPAPDVGNTLEAVTSAVPLLQERGFQFETVSEILCLKNSSRASLA
jgi:peptidoglycan/xylan/chitin deacetylase (PgdA/CDA1 family)